MTCYFSGNTLGSFYRTSTAIAEVTTAGTFDTPYVTNSINVPAAAGTLIRSWTFNATGTLYVRFTANFSSGVSASQFLQLNNGATPAFRLRYVSGGGMDVQSWNGTTWSTITGATTASNPTFGGTQIYMLKVVLGTSVTLYTAGTALFTSSGSLAGVATTITNAEWSWQTGAGFGRFSEMMIADFDLRDYHYYLDQPTAIGALTDGSGVIGDATETVLDESTSWALTASGNRRSGTHATFTPPTGYGIKAVAVAARGRVNGAGPTDGKVGIRKTTAGVNYSSAALGYNGGFEPRGNIWTTDPSTSAAWTTAGYNDAQVFVEAA